ncbi:MAG: TlpA family protein disulfide reductase [Robiginitalea sp.]|jgi:thiol-disulfide isomerase/thioredoxin
MMKAIFGSRSFRNNLIFLIVLGVVLYATGYHVRIYSGLRNRLIRTGIIAPKSLAAIDFESLQVSHGDMAGLGLIDEEGRHVTLGSFEDEILLVNVWASWCPPCVAEMPGLNALYESEKENVGFVLITWDKTMEAAQNYRDRKGYSFSIYKTAGQVPESLRARSIPTTFILDKNENTLYRYAGMIAFDDPEMKDFLQSLRE